MNEIEKAERVQAWKAFLIPASLFVACLFNAAGIYILYSGSAVGMVFLGIGITIICSGLFAFITFQNKNRARGEWKVLPETEPDTGSVAGNPENSNAGEEAQQESAQV